MITPDSPIIGPASGSLHAALDWAGSDNAEYVKELWRLCDLTGIDAGILFAQWAHETGDGTSHFWNAHRNPAGIGITGFPPDDQRSQIWATQTDAARGHVAHMLAYAYGGVLQWPDSVLQAFDIPPDYYDQRLSKPIVAKHRAANVRGLTGKWATDPAYHTKIVAKHRAIFGVNENADSDTSGGSSKETLNNSPQKGSPVTDSLVFGRVEYPSVVQRHLPASNPYVVASGAPAIPDAVFWHRMVGTLWGTNNHFHNGYAATMYGVGVVSIDGIDDAGKIIEWIKPGIGWYGESSGPAKGPYGDGAALIAEVGVNSVNRVSVAIEISGNYDTPLDEPARRSIVALTAYWADQKRIPWHQFPIVPGTQRSFVIWHQEITGPAYKACPGWQVMNETSALIARVRDVLKAAQTITEQPKPPAYEPSQLPEWWEQSIVQSWPSDADHDGVRYRVARRNVEALKPAVRRSAPDMKAPKSGPNFLVREKANVERVFDVPTVNAKGKTVNVHWILTADGHYVAASSFSPQIIVKPR